MDRDGRSITESGKTIEDAIENGAKKLGLSSDDLTVEVLEEGSRGLFGIGAKPCVVRLTEKQPKPIVEREKQPKSPPLSAVLQEDAKKRNTDLARKQEGRPQPAKANAERSEQDAPRKRNNNKRRGRGRDKRSQDIRDSLSYTAFVSGESDCPGAEFLNGLLERMGLSSQLSYAYAEGALYLRLNSEYIGILIGHRGETLDALQYLTNLAINRESEQYTRVFIDLENYRNKREENLIRLAKRLAKEAYESGDAILLEPMNPYERRVIHSCLQNDSKVITYSEGEDPNRYVVIEPAEVE